ncbi:ABC transporter permease [Candidatus Bathyarchaeota archaeon]|nr:ABC transporter permease [Candidatus Bathyarchaeota archaeon]
MNGLRRYIARRILEAIPLIFAIIVFNFVIFHIAPGDPTSYMMAGSGVAGIDPVVIEAMKKRWGLDKPLLEQLVVYLSGVIRGDLGYSFFRNKPVSEVILERVPATLLLILPSACASIVVGTLIGAYLAKRPGSKLDSTVSTFSSILYSVPVFWLGLILLIIFAFGLKLFPSSGMVSPIGEYAGSVTDMLQHLFLPSLTLFLTDVPIFIRTARASVIEIMREDFITTFKAMGLKENAVLYKHALRNALLPTVTIAGMLLGFLLTGAVLVETVFGWPGLGRTTYEAIYMRDYPLIMGIFVFSSIVFISITLVVDIVYAFLDPRVKYR